MSLQGPPQPLGCRIDGSRKTIADFLDAQEVPAGEGHCYLALFIVATFRSEEVGEFHLQDDRGVIAPLRCGVLDLVCDVSLQVIIECDVSPLNDGSACPSS